MIKLPQPGHYGVVPQATVLAKTDDLDAQASEVTTGRRIRGLVDNQYDFIWRSLRRLGVAAADTDDATQQVFVTAARKIDSIRVGSERQYRFSNGTPGCLGFPASPEATTGGVL